MEVKCKAFSKSTLELESVKKYLKPINVLQVSYYNPKW